MNTPAQPTHAKPKILFIHRSAGGQFEFLGAWLAQNGWDVTFAFNGLHGDKADGPNLRYVVFQMRTPVVDRDSYVHAPAFAAANALAVAELLVRLRNTEGYVPNVVMAHVGWGVGLCVKQIWPETRYIAYHEWYYTQHNWDTGMAESPATVLQMISDRMRNLPITTEFDTADANWCPTQFQANRFPPALRNMIEVVSDGVDCETFRPDPDAKLDFEWLSLPDAGNILTYATRGMEPTRGFPQFMRALEELQKRRDDFHTVILANDSVSYGGQLPSGETWRLKMLDDLNIDQRKLHVFGMRSRTEYLRVLQASSAHCYFSEPFVTSWSLSEALASGCMVIGSNTAPVQELITDMDNGILVDMDDPEEVADMIEFCFDRTNEVSEMRENARNFILNNHDSRVVFPRKERVLRSIFEN